jgi:molybdenum cofactor cytidylyltransferase
MNRVFLPGLRVIILAAGFSSRLGRAKALARVNGITLLRRTLQVVAALNPAQIFVVVPRNAASYRIETGGIAASFIVNTRRDEGLSSSVRRGVAKARFSSALLLLPVDLSDLKVRELARLVARWRAVPRRVAARRIGARRSGGRGATPIILPRRFYASAQRISGDAGLRDLVSQLPAECRVLVDLPSADRDIDTPRDLEAARRRFRRGC